MGHMHSELKRIWSRTRGFFSIYYYNRLVPVVSSPLFYLPLVLKCVAAFLFASYFATDLFLPFIKYFVFTGQNPYSHFLEIGVANAFPYPALMLWILSSFYAVFGLFTNTTLLSISHADLFLLRIPLLVADVGILLILLSWFEKKQQTVMWLYWCSPIIFYISYIHGQLDALPIFFLFCFLFLLFKERDIPALIFLGLSISTKTGMVIVFPFICLYLIKERQHLRKTLLKLILPILVFILVNIGYLFDSAFTNMVFHTKEQLKVFDLVFEYSQGLTIYIVPVVYLVMLFKFATFKRYSRDLFMTFLGFSFFIITLCIPPMPGWYYWIIPFAVYFYVRANNRQRILYHFITIGYFIYFALISHSDLFSAFNPLSSKTYVYKNFYNFGIAYNWPVELLSNLSFTILQTILLLNIYWIYRKGVEHYTRYKMHYKPFLIGVAGDSGSGKSTFAKLMVDVFANRHVSVIAGDDMHKWERGSEQWTKYTHLDPRANELHSDIDSIYNLKHGESIHRRQYDHVLGKFTLPKKLDSKRVVIFEGLHSLFLEKTRKAFDLKIFIAPEDQLKLHWKIIRDSESRGYSRETILEQIESRQNDVEQYISVQEKYSDVFISLKNSYEFGNNVGNKNAKLSLMLEITCANDIGLQILLEELSNHIDIDYRIKDGKQTIKFSGEISQSTIEEVAKTAIPELDQLSIEHRTWHANYNGIIQLFIAFYIFESMRLERYD